MSSTEGEASSGNNKNEHHQRRRSRRQTGEGFETTGTETEQMEQIQEKAKKEALRSIAEETTQNGTPQPSKKPSDIPGTTSDQQVKETAQQQVPHSGPASKAADIDSSITSTVERTENLGALLTAASGIHGRPEDTTYIESPVDVRSEADPDGMDLDTPNFAQSRSIDDTLQAQTDSDDNTSQAQEQAQQEQTRQEQTRQEQARQEQARQEQARQEQIEQEQARNAQAQQEQARQEQIQRGQVAQEELLKKELGKLWLSSEPLSDNSKKATETELSSIAKFFNTERISVPWNDLQRYRGLLTDGSDNEASEAYRQMSKYLLDLGFSEAILPLPDENTFHTMRQSKRQAQESVSSVGASPETSSETVVHVPDDESPLELARSGGQTLYDKPSIVGYFPRGSWYEVLLSEGSGANQRYRLTTGGKILSWDPKAPEGRNLAAEQRDLKKGVSGKDVQAVLAVAWRQDDPNVSAPVTEMHPDYQGYPHTRVELKWRGLDAPTWETRTTMRRLFTKAVADAIIYQKAGRQEEKYQVSIGGSFRFKRGEVDPTVQNLISTPEPQVVPINERAASTLILEEGLSLPRRMPISIPSIETALESSETPVPVLPRGIRSTRATPAPNSNPPLGGRSQSSPTPALTDATTRLGSPEVFAVNGTTAVKGLNENAFSKGDEMRLFQLFKHALVQIVAEQGIQNSTGLIT